MGKERNRIKTLLLGYLITSILILTSCALEKKEESYLYEGSYTYIKLKGNKEIEGKWRAIFMGEKLEKCFVYTSFGFPIATIEVKDDNSILINQEPLELDKGNDSITKAVSFAILNLKRIIDSNYSDKVNLGEMQLEKVESKRIKVEHPGKWVLYIDVEDIKRL